MKGKLNNLSETMLGSEKSKKNDFVRHFQEQKEINKIAGPKLRKLAKALLTHTRALQNLKQGLDTEPLSKSDIRVLLALEKNYPKDYTKVLDEVGGQEDSLNRAAANLARALLELREFATADIKKVADSLAMVLRKRKENPNANINEEEFHSSSLIDDKTGETIIDSSLAKAIEEEEEKIPVTVFAKAIKKIDQVIPDNREEERFESPEPQSKRGSRKLLPETNIDGNEVSVKPNITKAKAPEKKYVTLQEKFKLKQKKAASDTAPPPINKKSKTFNLSDFQRRLEQNFGLKLTLKNQPAAQLMALARSLQASMSDNTTAMTPIFKKQVQNRDLNTEALELKRSSLNSKITQISDFISQISSLNYSPESVTLYRNVSKEGQLSADKVRDKALDFNCQLALLSEQLETINRNIKWKIDAIKISPGKKGDAQSMNSIEGGFGDKASKVQIIRSKSELKAAEKFRTQKASMLKTLKQFRVSLREEKRTLEGQIQILAALTNLRLLAQNSNDINIKVTVPGQL